MANSRLIKRRIKSAQNITQITKAMEMVAASKMKKAQEKAVLGKPYAERIYLLTKELAQHTERDLHPLLFLGNPEGRTLVVLISTDKGLCGSLNTNLFRLMEKVLKEESPVDFITCGKKGQNFIVRTGSNLVASTGNIPAITSMAVDGFINGQYKEVYLAFNTFFTAFRQIPTKKLILPIASFAPTEGPGEIKFPEFVVEPHIFDILEHLLPLYLENQIRSAILEAEACEQSARMMAMKTATDAAFDLMMDLTLIYNKARQEKITSEIADIVTARLAVETL